MVHYLSLEANENAREHSREYFRNVNRSLYRMLGYRPRRTIVASGASTSRLVSGRGCYGLITAARAMMMDTSSPIERY